MSTSLANRARVAWINRHKKSDPPVVKNTSVASVNGRIYVILMGEKETLAVYRVRTDGILKYLRRWPTELRRLSSTKT